MTTRDLHSGLTGSDLESLSWSSSIPYILYAVHRRVTLVNDYSGSGLTHGVLDTERDPAGNA